jgi:hypothetical protein
MPTEDQHALRNQCIPIELTQEADMQHGRSNRTQHPRPQLCRHPRRHQPHHTKLSWTVRKPEVVSDWGVIAHLRILSKKGLSNHEAILSRYAGKEEHLCFGMFPRKLRGN